MGYHDLKRGFMETLKMPKDKLVKYLEMLQEKRNKMTNDNLKDWFKVGNQIIAIKQMLKRGTYVE